MVGIAGIGPVGSAMLAALFSRVSFGNADAVVAYSGLDPRPIDSGKRTGRRRISKRGSALFRLQLYLAALGASHSHALGPTYRAIKARGFAPTQALVILARKILRIAWAVWKSGKPFDPTLIHAHPACAGTLKVERMAAQGNCRQGVRCLLSDSRIERSVTIPDRT